MSVSFISNAQNLEIENWKKGKLYRFPAYNRTYIFILGFLDHMRTFRCNQCNNKNNVNKYVLINNNTLYVFDSCFTIDKGYPIKLNVFFEGMNNSKIKDFARDALIVNDIVEKDRPVNEIDAIHMSICKRKYFEAEKFLKNDLRTIAYAQLVIKSYMERKLTTNESIFYLQTAFKKTISDDQKKTIIALNKIMLDGRPLPLSPFSNPPFASVNSALENSTTSTTTSTTQKRKLDAENNGARRKKTSKIQHEKEVPHHAQNPMIHFEPPSTATIREIFQETLNNPSIRERLEHIFNPYADIQRIVGDILDNPDFKGRIDNIFMAPPVKIADIK